MFQYLFIIVVVILFLILLNKKKPTKIIKIFKQEPRKDLWWYGRNNYPAGYQHHPQSSHTNGRDRQEI